MTDSNLCKHETMMTDCRITNLEDAPHVHVLELDVRCKDCDQEFEFVGLPHGVSFYRPTVSIDNRTPHLPFKNVGSTMPTNLAGFSLQLNPSTDEH